MNFSAMSRNDQIALVAGAVVVLSGLLSVYFEWGWVMLIGVLAGLLAVAAIASPSMLTGFRISGSKGAHLLIAGVGASLLYVLSGIDSLNWLLNHLATVDALQYIVGIVAAIALLYAGWMTYSSEGQPAAAAPMAPPPAAEPPAMG